MQNTTDLTVLLDLHKKICGDAMDLLKSKNADYTNDAKGHGGVFSNLNKAEAFGICSTEQGILVRMTDKLARLASLIEREGHVRSETMRDTIVDLINYAILLDAWVSRKTEQTNANTGDK